MKKSTKAILLSAGVILSFTGCQKGTTPGQYAGEEIHFTAGTAKPATKTAYSGEGTTGADGNLTWERIDWTDGDRILIWSNNATGRAGQTNAEYAVINPQANGNISKAETLKINQDVLAWGEADTYSFWSIYPSTAGTSASGWTDNKVTYSIPASQTPKETKEETEGDIKHVTLTPDMSKAVMLAANTSAEAGTNVQLDFYPAYTAFEINLKSVSETGFTLKSMTLSAVNGSAKLAGPVAAEIETGTTNNSKGRIIGKSKLTPSDSEGTTSVVFTFPSAVTVSKSQDVIFTVFTTPVDLDGLKLGFTFLNGEEEFTQTATLKKKEGETATDIIFGACEKHRIVALNLDGAWNFKYLDLEGKAIEWDYVELEPVSEDYPEATQFEVTGVNNGRYYASAEATSASQNNKTYRQYWLLNSEKTATVRFKVMSPVNYYWKVVPQGDTGAFTITPGAGATLNSDGSLTGGPIGQKDADGKYLTTNVNFSVAQNGTQSGQKVLYFKTFVYSEDGTVQYSLDTETQLLDMRGYHYFILNWGGSTVNN